MFALVTLLFPVRRVGVFSGVFLSSSFIFVLGELRSMGVRRFFVVKGGSFCGGIVGSFFVVIVFSSLVDELKRWIAGFWIPTIGHLALFNVLIIYNKFRAHPTHGAKVYQSE